MKSFFGGHTKKRSWSLWGKTAGKSCTNNFSGKFGDMRAKNRTPKMCLLLHLWWKSTFASVAPLFERTEGEMTPPCPHSPASLCILFYRTLFTRCCKLQSVTVMNINYSISGVLRQQFITAKNALKQGCRTHSVLRQRSPQLQKYKTTRMSCRIAVDQKVCGWNGGHPGLTVWNLQTTHELRMRINYARKIFVFFMWLLCVQLLRRKNRYGLVWAIMISPPELPVNDEALNEAHIARTGVRTRITRIIRTAWVSSTGYLLQLCKIGVF